MGPKVNLVLSKTIISFGTVLFVMGPKEMLKETKEKLRFRTVLFVKGITLFLFFKKNQQTKKL